MADNYLERKMDELRQGKIRGGVQRIRPSLTSTPGKAVFDFPPRRILMLCNPSEYAAMIAGIFADKASRVAVFGAGLPGPANAGSIRYTRLDLADVALVQTETKALLKVWRGIDIIVSIDARPAALQAATACWQGHMSTFPRLTDYRPRIITLGSVMHEHPGQPFSFFAVGCEGLTPRDIAFKVLFASLPQASAIDEAFL